MRSKKALYNIISTFIYQITMVICNFVLPIMIIGKFGSKTNGLISSISQFLAYITLLDSGFGVVIRSCLYKPLANKNKEEIENILCATQKFFRGLALIFIVYIIILCFVYPYIVLENFNFTFTLSMIIILSLSTFFEYFFGMTYKILLYSDQKNYVISNIQTVTTILNGIVAVILILNNYSIQVVKLCSALIFIIRPLFLNLYVKKKYNLSFKNADKNYKIKRKWDGLAQHIAGVIHSNTDVVILTFYSLTDISVYSIYSAIILAVKNIVTSFTGGIDATFGDMLAKEEYENLNKKFSLYEFIYTTITTIVFLCTFILILPFISVYTKNITDVNYIRPMFAYLLVIAEFMHALRIPYSGITLAAGHFKETKKGAILETLINLIISLILVRKFGLIGVAIGTLIAMFIRTIEFMYHTSKNILNRNFKKCLKHLFSILLEFVIVIFVSNFIPSMTTLSYINWIVYAIIIFIISFMIVLIINILFFKAEIKEVIYIFKNLKNRRGVK